MDSITVLYVVGAMSAVILLILRYERRKRKILGDDYKPRKREKEK